MPGSSSTAQGDNQDNLLLQNTVLALFILLGLCVCYCFFKQEIPAARRWRSGPIVEAAEEDLERRKQFIDKNLPVKEFKKNAVGGGDIEERKGTKKDLETISKDEGDDGCPVCLSGYQGGDEVSWSTNTACEHLFHKDCIRAWLLKHHDCPMCRNAFLPEEESEEGEEEIVPVVDRSNAVSADSGDSVAEENDPA